MQRQSVQKYLGLFLDEKLSLYNIIDEIMEKSYTQTESLTTMFVVASSL